MDVLLPSVCSWTERGLRRWVKWSIERSITCLCYIKAEKNSGQIRSTLPSCKHWLHDQSHSVPCPSSSSVLPSHQRHSKSLPLLVASFMYITPPSVHFSFSWLQFESWNFFLVCLPLHIICCLYSRGKRIIVARSTVPLRLSQDALWCIINILPKDFSSGQQPLAPAYAQVIQL